MHLIPNTSAPSLSWPRAFSWLAALAFLGGAVAGPLPAHANDDDVDCLSLPNPSIGVGGSAQRPLLGRLASVLADQDEPSTLIYAAPGACNGINLLRDNQTLYSGTASYWLADGTERTCVIEEPGVVIDYAVMGNAVDKCPGITEVPDGIADLLGPVGTVNLFVPIASTEQSISSEALYFAYGFGADGGAEPWTDESQLISRDENSFVALYVSLAAGLPVSRLLGVDARTNGNSVALVAGSPNPNAAIGFASGSVADSARDRVRTLAYQHVGQDCAYWPDSTATSFDKRNVRDGHYWIWGAFHIFPRIDGSGEIVNETSRRWIGWLTGDEPEPDNASIIDIVIENGDIPQCAMTVRRDGDLTPPYSWAPPEPCGCYFEQVATGESPCASCSEDSDCAGDGERCRRGFCEPY